MATETAVNLAFVYAGVAVSNVLHLIQLTLHFVQFWDTHGKSYILISIIFLFVIGTLALTVPLAVYESKGTKEVARDWITLSLEVLLLAEGITIEVHTDSAHLHCKLTNVT
jgi:hypothetical protein